MLVGITGSIGMGKTVVTKYLLSQGYQVIDSDLIAKEELDNLIVIKELVEYFKADILEDGQVNKKKLGRIIFENKMHRLKLNSIVHPRVIKRIEEMTKDSDELIFVDIPLLFEVNLEMLVDKIIVVYTSLATQINRLKRRDKIDENYARLKISSQIDIEIKKQKADYLIDNDYELDNTYKQIEKILWRLKNEV